MAKRHLRMKKEMHQLKEGQYHKEDEFSGKDSAQKMNLF